MTLIIFYTRVIIAFIGARSHNARVPGLPFIKGKADIVIRRIRHLAVKPELAKLFDPIKENADTNRIKSIFPVQTAFNKRRQAYTQNSQRQQMPPDELCCPPYLAPNSVNSIHHFSPFRPFILSPLSSGKLFKNNISFNRSQNPCP